MDSKTLLEAKNLSVMLGGKEILKNISFSVAPQEVLAVIGPNGAGKSVLLKVLMGLLKSSSGTIAWKKNIKIGYLPQRFHVDSYLPMTVYEFLKLKPNYNGSGEKVLSLVGLDAGWLKKNLAHLSGGELQKVLLAWTLINNPEILLFDEPTENVDIVGQESIYNILHHLQDVVGVAIIIISHDLNVVYRYANNVICLNKNMLCYGAPDATLTADRLSELYSDHAFFHHHHEHEGHHEHHHEEK